MALPGQVFWFARDIEDGMRDERRSPRRNSERICREAEAAVRALKDPRINVEAALDHLAFAAHLAGGDGGSEVWVKLRRRMEEEFPGAVASV